VHRAVAADGWKEAAGLVLSGEVDAAAVVTLEGVAPDLEPCAAPDRVELDGYESGRVRIHVDMACKGMLVVADSWYPGWEARVDGQPAAIHRAYGVVRAVEIGAGRHDVELVYRSASIVLGLSCALLGIGVCAGLAYAESRARRRPRFEVGEAQALSQPCVRRPAVSAQGRGAP
jgi:hypothetical protein